MDYRAEIAKLINIGAEYDAVLAALAVPAEESMGDICLPCFKFSRELRAAPPAVAKAAFDALPSPLPAFLARAEAAGGYLNFYLDRRMFVQNLLKAGAFAKHPANGKTVCIDYSSVNIAKPFHMGHLSTTAIGGSLCRIFAYLGYKVVGINHLGDFGTQFGKLIAAYKRWGDEAEINTGKTRALSKIYARFHAEEEKDPALTAEARAWSKRIDDGDPEAVRLFDWFKELTLAEVGKIYGRLGVAFDSYHGESFFVPMVPNIVKELEDKGLLAESEGARVVDLAAHNMPPCLILRADGVSLYATRDLAAAQYRQTTYGFDKCLYVVAYQQNLHFQQVFKVLELMGCGWVKDMAHVAFGMVSLEEGAMSTRAGNVVLLADVLDAAVAKAKEIMSAKSAELSDFNQIAEQVGTGAVVYTAVCNARIKDIVFSLSKVLSFEGETGPYLQYTHARCCSVIAKAMSDHTQNSDSLSDSYDIGAIANDEAFSLAKELADFEAAVADAAKLYEPCMVSKKLIAVAKAFNKFYIAHKINDPADPGGMAAKLALTALTRDVLAKGLELILLAAPQKM
ncbi:MAG: arginine--tRNA ligase [Firmicutes bacterium]|nr:arginine--tRNA ligase [Bacillota bacterium]